MKDLYSLETNKKNLVKTVGCRFYQNLHLNIKKKHTDKNVSPSSFTYRYQISGKSANKQKVFFLRRSPQTDGKFA